MSVPPQFVGAWRRVGLTLDRARLVDYCDVLWLQTPTWFADVRLRLVPDQAVPADGVPDWFYPAAAFAGISHWSPPRMTWEHALDFDRSVPAGSNVLRAGDGVVVEEGLTSVGGQQTPFSEEWLRLTDDDVSASVTAADGHARIEIGRWAIELRDERPVGRFTATRFEAHDRGWAPTGHLSS